MSEQKTPGQFVLTPALCLDLDGTVRVSKSGVFIQGPDDIALMPGIEPLIWAYRDKGYFIVALTNQGGVAFGLKTAQQAVEEIRATEALFERNPFHSVNASFCMADGIVEPYNHRSLFRKPDIGMLCQAELDAAGQGLLIDWDRSLLVGDREDDAQCAGNAGITFVHIDHFLTAPGPQEDADGGN